MRAFLHVAALAAAAALQTPMQPWGTITRGGSSPSPSSSGGRGRLQSARDATLSRSDLLRRTVPLGASTLLAAALGAPSPAQASYALYSASQQSFTDRKATGYVPVATSDKASLAAIQDEISRKRPANPMKMKKPPKYCAGQMASVQPMMENVCANIGISKADQSNTMVDEFGNMNIGVYNERYKKAQEAAMENERLRRKAAVM